MTVMLSITTENTLLTSTCSENLWGNVLQRVANLKAVGWMFVKALTLTTQPHFQTLPSQTHQIHSWSTHDIISRNSNQTLNRSRT